MNRRWTKQSLYRAVDKLRDRLQVSHLDHTYDLRTALKEAAIPMEVEELPFRTPGLHGIASIGSENEPDVILLNSKYRDQVKRFDLAHEVFHCAYHRNLGVNTFSCYEVVDTHQNPYLEWQANEAAAEMLLPYRIFIPLAASARIEKSSQLRTYIERWAAVFNVAPRNIEMRLESLKYEILQYRRGVPLDQLVFLSRREQALRGIHAESLMEFTERLRKAERQQQEYSHYDMSFGAPIPHEESFPTGFIAWEEISWYHGRIWRRSMV